MGSIKQQQRRPEPHKAWTQAVRNTLLRNLLLLLLGFFFQLFVLFSAQNRGLLVAAAEWIRPALWPLLLGYLLLLSLLPLLSLLFLRSWRALAARTAAPAEDARAGQWRQGFRPVFTAIGTLALLPLPLYLLLFPDDALGGILGIACCLAQGYYVLSSLDDAPNNYFAPFFLRRDEREGLPTDAAGYLSASQISLLHLVLCGSLIMLLCTAGALSPRHGGLFWSALAFTLGVLLYHIMLELRLLTTLLLRKRWRERRRQERNAGSGQQSTFLAQLHDSRSFLLSLPAVFWLLSLASIVVLVIVSVPATRAYWLLALFVRQLLGYLFVAKVNGADNSPWEHLHKRPGQVLVSSFLFLILMGGIILALPCCSTTGESIGTLNGLFTATSAVCVTGLSVLDPATSLSHLGKLVMLFLIQCGGLGIMTMSFFVVLLLRRRLSLHDGATLQAMTGEERNVLARQRLRVIILGTLLIEGFGALLMTAAYHWRFGYGWLASLGHGTFMSISAFCNAGVSLHSDSVMLFSDSMWPLLTMATLIFLGGLGFEPLLGGLRRLFSRQRLPMAAHVRLILLMSAILTLGGCLLIYCLDGAHALAGMTPARAAANALFHSVSTRTAGFNAVNLTQQSNALHFLSCVLMFIGAAPGSTGGGVKVSTVGILLLLLRSRLRGQREVIFAGRRIQAQSILQAAALVTVTALMLCLGIFLLALLMPQEPLDKLAYEVVSATSTTGLSLGSSMRLPTAGKILVMALMFLGRVGPLSFFLALRTRQSSRVSYPDAQLMI
jgi:trk system potassium uptake protein TrkH